MAAITDTVGTTGRDFSTWTLWIASLGAHGSDDVAGEGYNDSVFDETVLLNDGTPISVKMTVALGERHDGTAGTGVRIVTSIDRVYLVRTLVDNNTVEWVEFDHNQVASGVDKYIARFANNNTVVQRCIFHGLRTSALVSRAVRIDSMNIDVHNNILYDVEGTNTSTGIVYGFTDLEQDTNLNFQNNTVHDIVNNNGSGACLGIHIQSASNAARKVRNNICTDVDGGDTSGTESCYDIDANLTESHNLSSDATAAGTGSLTSKSSANQYVSTTGGSEDLHLKSGADAIDAGTDLGTTPAGVEIDIDNRNRDTEGDTWDMGAHEFVAVTAVAPLINKGLTHSHLLGKLVT